MKTYKQFLTENSDARTDILYDILLDGSITNEELKFSNKDLELIKRNPELAFRYCERFGVRWPEAEYYILKDAGKRIQNFMTPDDASHEMSIAVSYAIMIIKGPWKELEPILLKSKQKTLIVGYTLSARRKLWPEAERLILSFFKTGDPRLDYPMIDYLKLGPVPTKELEAIYKRDIELYSEYIKYKDEYSEYANQAGFADVYNPDEDDE